MFILISLNSFWAQIQKHCFHWVTVPIYLITKNPWPRSGFSYKYWKFKVAYAGLWCSKELGKYIVGQTLKVSCVTPRNRFLVINSIAIRFNSCFWRRLIGTTWKITKYLFVTCYTVELCSTIFICWFKFIAYGQKILITKT